MTWNQLYKIENVSINQKEFGEKVISISNEMGINPNWLMGLMYFETAKTLSHTITNNLGCVGLIQFCSIARRELNVTSSRLKTMSNVEQLDYVRKYFLGVSWKRNLVSKVRNVTDLYLIIFYPVAVGKSSDYVLGSHNGTFSNVYKHNPSFQDGTGKVKVKNVVNKINSFLSDMPGLPPLNQPPIDGGMLPSTKNDNGFGLALLALLFLK